MLGEKGNNKFAFSTKKYSWTWDFEPHNSEA